MVLKRKNKVSKRLKKGMRGGDVWENIKNDLLSLRLDTKIYTEWKNFIDYLLDIFKLEQQQQQLQDGTNISENISEEEYIETLMRLRELNIIRPLSAQPSARPLSAARLLRTKGFSGQMSPHIESPQSPQKEKPHILNTIKKEEIILKFYTIFKQILIIVNNDRNNPNKSKPFKDLMNMVNKLPEIDKSLNALIAENVNNLESVYLKILQLLKENCSGWRGTFCSGAVLILGENVQKLYEELKNNIKITEGQISNDILIKFIKDVLPIMKPKLANIKIEFKTQNEALDEIDNMLALKSGGKKSSRAVRKEIQGKPIVITKKLILGKERCIYKVQGSNKEHVKYKGTLIPVADFKKLMKV
uniref:Uncharacterized protein n=1 Tax=viral metagenome TaxID=1070528 RepID=A0A6C0LCL7_9ZZZZ